MVRTLSSGIKTAKKRRIVDIITEGIDNALSEDRLCTKSDLRRTGKIIYKRVAEECGWYDKKSKTVNRKA